MIEKNKFKRKDTMVLLWKKYIWYNRAPILSNLRYIKEDRLKKVLVLHQHTFVHTHDGSTHTHTVEHSHDHSHYVTDDKHGHHHSKEELEKAMMSK